MSGFFVLDDMKCRHRDAFVCPCDEVEEKFHNYSGYYLVKGFETEAEAESFCESYNRYDGEPDEVLSCCSNGCRMTAYEAAHWNGLCAYTGE